MGEAPENTLVSFQRAFDDGAECVEFDVRGSKDGEVMIFHDATLQRTTNGRGRLHQRTVAELKTLDAGYRFSAGGEGPLYRRRGITIPTLAEFFATFSKARAIIEIKQRRPTIVERVVETIRRFGKEEEVLLATESDLIMDEIRGTLVRAKLSIATGFAYGEVAEFFAWAASGKSGAYRPLGQAFQIPREYRGLTLVSERTIAAAHELGVEMFVWTINDSREMERLLGMGVDGIITDYPGRARRIIGRG